MNGARPRSWEQVANLYVRAMRAGAVPHSPGAIRWNIAGRCQAPQTVILTGRPSEGVRDTRRSRVSRYVSLIPGLTKTTVTVELETRCRRCVWCLRRRAKRWRAAALTEIDQASGRSWFGTLTFSPDWRFRVVAKASRSAAAKGEDLERLEPEARFKYVANASGELVTKWLKRVRKESGAKLRYLLVVEAHKSGDPHFHVLIHESEIGQPVRELTLRTQWSHGFSKFNLVRDRAAAGYATKYLSKSLMARVRASVRYGKPRPIGIVAKQRVDPDHQKQLYAVAALLGGTGLGGSISGGEALPSRSCGGSGAGLSTVAPPTYASAAGKRQCAEAAQTGER